MRSTIAPRSRSTALSWVSVSREPWQLRPRERAARTSCPDAHMRDFQIDRPRH
jgi:hypothetical protein